MNIIYFGKYTLNPYFASAGAKRVINQIKYLEKENNIKIITISKYNSNIDNHINFKRFENKLLQIFFLPFYWLSICSILITKKQHGKNIILLESLLELNFAIPVLFSKVIGYKVVHDVVENFFVEQQDTTKSQKKNQILSRFFFKNIKLYADGIIVISENLLKQYADFNLPLIKIYNTIDIFDNELTIPFNKAETIFLYSGTFGTKDGVKDLILAFNNILNSLSDIRLVLTGKNDSIYFHECMDLIKGNDKISFLGYLDPNELIMEYQKSDVLVITRDNSLFANYGFPYKLSEYLSYKKPVICSAISDIPALFTDYVDILLTQPSNIESIINKMKYSIEHKSELMQIAENGFKKCYDYFSISKNGKKLYDFLLEI
jgi:glycosyltransferase involved in cell wall biosynthesis